MHKNIKKVFDAIMNDKLTLAQRRLLENLSLDSRKVIRVSKSDLNVDDYRSLVEMDLVEITTERNTINFKITKKGRNYE